MSVTMMPVVQITELMHQNLATFKQYHSFDNPNYGLKLTQMSIQDAKILKMSKNKISLL